MGSIDKFHLHQIVKYTSGELYKITGTPKLNSMKVDDENWLSCYSYVYINNPSFTYHRSKAQMEDGRFVAHK